MCVYACVSLRERERDEARMVFDIYDYSLDEAVVG